MSVTVWQGNVVPNVKVHVDGSVTESTDGASRETFTKLLFR